MYQCLHFCHFQTKVIQTQFTFLHPPSFNSSAAQGAPISMVCYYTDSSGKNVKSETVCTGINFHSRYILGRVWHFGFETFTIFWIVSDSASKKFGIKKSIGFGIGKNLVSKKVSDSVSEIFGIGKKIWIRIRSDFGYRQTLPTNSTDTLLLILLSCPTHHT